MRPGRTRRPLRSISLVPRAASFLTRRSSPVAMTSPSRMAIASTVELRLSTVEILPS